MNVRSRSSIAGLAAIAALFCQAPLAAAHPHVWVTVACEVVLDNESRVTAIRQTWSYDAMYSSYALYGLDKDGDGELSGPELEPLVTAMVAELRPRKFFTAASVDGVAATLSDATGQSLAVDPEGDLTLSFTQTVEPAVALKGKTLSLEVHDVDFFVDFEFSKERFATITPPTPGCAAALRDSSQPPKGSNPDDLMAALINGPIVTLASAVTVVCR